MPFACLNKLTTHIKKQQNWLHCAGNGIESMLYFCFVNYPIYTKQENKNTEMM